MTLQALASGQPIVQTQVTGVSKSQRTIRNPNIQRYEKEEENVEWGVLSAMHFVVNLVDVGFGISKGSRSEHNLDYR